MRRTLLTLCVALSLVVAGCSGLGGSDTETEPTGTESPTTTGTPTDGSPSEPVDNPRETFSWLTESGVNESALLRAHALAVINESSYRTRATQRTVATDSDNESVTRYSLAASATQQRSLYGIDTTVRAASQTRTDNRTRYRGVTDGSQTVYYRTAVDGNVSYRVQENPYRDFSTFYRQSTGYDLTFSLTAFVLAYDGTVQREGQTLYRHTGDSLKTGASFAEDATNVSVTVLVSDRGVIRSLAYSFESTSNAIPVHITYTFETTGLGETTVERPEWVDQAQSS
mgnify:CR=1 FL=1